MVSKHILLEGLNLFHSATASPWSPTMWHAIKEEIKVTNRDRVDYQACSLLLYINVIANLFKANLFIIGNYFNELRWKL